jgi:hypothetical protein
MADQTYSLKLFRDVCEEGIETSFHNGSPIYIRARTFPDEEGIDTTLGRRFRQGGLHRVLTMISGQEPERPSAANRAAERKPSTYTDAEMG